MLIDTKQIIPVTQFRLRLSEIIDSVYHGHSFIISEKGKIKAKISPPEEAKQQDRRYLLEEIRKIREKNDRYYRKAKKVWNSVDMIRKMRKERIKHILSLSK